MMSPLYTGALRFQVGARTLMTIPRRLIRLSVDLGDAIAGNVPALPALPDDADGYFVSSVPEQRRLDLAARAPGLFAHVRQEYRRYYTDLTMGFDAYQAQMSGNTRSGMKRKAKKVAEASGGALQISRFATPVELADFHPVARAISAMTYQEKLLGGGLPRDAAFMTDMMAAAAANRIRAWLLHIGGAPAAYLYCEARGDTLYYDHVGHDPRFGELSPGLVLMLEAMRDLMAERAFARFDFTEGEGQHKRQFSTGGVDCCDVILLRAGLANRAATAALGGFDRLTATAKHFAQASALKGLAKKVRRAS